jgi:hypothetical protein
MLLEVILVIEKLRKQSTLEIITKRPSGKPDKTLDLSRPHTHPPRTPNETNLIRHLSNHSQNP